MLNNRLTKPVTVRYRLLADYESEGEVFGYQYCESTNPKEFLRFLHWLAEEDEDDTDA